MRGNRDSCRCWRLWEGWEAGNSLVPLGLGGLWWQLLLGPALGISRLGNNRGMSWKLLAASKHLAMGVLAVARGCWVPGDFSRADCKSTDLFFHGWGGIHLGGIWVGHHQVENVGP